MLALACYAARDSVMKGSLSGKTTETMNSLLSAGRQVLLAAIIGSLAMHAVSAFAQPSTGGQATNGISIAGFQGTVEISPSGVNRWFPVSTNQILSPFDRLRTGPNSRVTVRWSEQSDVSYGPLTQFEIT